MDKDTLLALLKEHLRVEVSTKHRHGSYGSADNILITTKLFFDDEEISSSEDYFDLPKTEEQKIYF